jgi:putative redox protein
MSRDVAVTSKCAGYLQNISIGQHRIQADEPAEAGGCDAGPNPYELLLAALGACTSMTLRMYANRKRWPLEDIRVRLMHGKMHAEDCLSCETKEGLVDRIEREIFLVGNLTDEQRQRLLGIANNCPVHRTLTSEIHIETRLTGSRKEVQFQAGISPSASTPQ